jgi:hypothetical protein
MSDNKKAIFEIETFDESKVIHWSDGSVYIDTKGTADVYLEAKEIERKRDNEINVNF